MYIQYIIIQPLLYRHKLQDLQHMLNLGVSQYNMALKLFCTFCAKPAELDFAHIYSQRRAVFKIRSYDGLVCNTSSICRYYITYPI